MVNHKELVVCDRDILGGTAVFAGTRVPVQTLFDYLEGGDSLETFLDDFPTVTRKQIVAFLGQASNLFVQQVSHAYSA
ncbi:MAG: DUF433 domain-containing protein [Chloroflexi bacterium]|nr:DUF433 domain-containing protein [Chloroflexota bacterium]MBP8054728.1 DUF433 domain-containing protein [Chloroflexota bacterium]